MIYFSEIWVLYPCRCKTLFTQLKKISIMDNVEKMRNRKMENLKQNSASSNPENPCGTSVYGGGAQPIN